MNTVPELTATTQQKFAQAFIRAVQATGLLCAVGRIEVVLEGCPSFETLVSFEDDLRAAWACAGADFPPCEVVWTRAPAADSRSGHKVAAFDCDGTLLLRCSFALTELAPVAG